MMALIWGRYSALFYVGVLTVLAAGAAPFLEAARWALPVFALLSALGISDLVQRRHGVLSNYPLLGRVRYAMESIRPELRQYFWEADTDELPYSRNQRAIVYQRAKGLLAARPFGSDRNMYEGDHCWLNHSLAPSHIDSSDFRIIVGEGPRAYAASLLNISGTSFGALSPPAIQALSRGARLGGFAHNTGEGAFSPYHAAGGGDTIWQVSTGYFGCRTADGRFDPDRFADVARRDQIKMIEIKLSQGAKPGHGGMLLAPKVTPEIAQTRGVAPWADVISPASHSTFDTPEGLLDFVGRLRALSDGKPVGIKLCIGHPWEFLAILRAMVDTGKMVDFITIDGAEGGTGAAPVEFVDNLGTPLRDGVIFADNALRGAGLRDRVRLAAAGKLVSGFDVVRLCALGADWCNMARPFMFTLGCIQARDCASGNCPTGVATMDQRRHRAIDVDDRAKRVENFHRNTLHSVKELLEAAGLQHPRELTRRHIVRRLRDGSVKRADELNPRVAHRALIDGGLNECPNLTTYWPVVQSNSFALIGEDMTTGMGAHMTVSAPHS